ncbi:hypothetical protein [Rubripirellula reticaptiva]|uniref:Secreted protein n=1 Tax=Rubripirellula reticaptiva TaxID=2528013 RepID=A0A5C6E7L2_9BACT|nr:hypothetical protein [Rubripirellula reticaptiva]TWU44555.1 hypothetical protein Poly59_61370 [Rubripirellula reticaptiva]
MYRLAGWLLSSSLVVFIVAGCGSSTEPKNVADGVEQDKLAEYEAMVAAESTGMSEADAKP